MSRHRIVRTMDYTDEYDGYDDVYGHSVDDETGISPTDASQWIYDRAKGQQSISEFIKTNRNIKEEDEEEDEDEKSHLNNDKKRRDSENFQMPVLKDLEKIKLTSCIDEIRNVVGDTFSDKRIVEAVMQHNFDYNKALDFLLNDNSKERTEQLQAKDVSFKIQNNIENEKRITIKLDDLIKKNLTTINKNDKIAKSTTKFVLPVLKKPQINIPQLKTGSQSCSNNQDIIDFKHKIFKNVSDKMEKLTINEDNTENENNLDVIDLTKALGPSTILNIEKPIHPLINDIFFIPFTEYDIPKKKSFFKQNPGNFLMYKTSFSKIMSLKFQNNPKFSIKHTFKTKHKISPFNFSSLSPDDKILQYIKKVRNV